MMSTEEKLVLQGRKLLEITQARAAASVAGVFVDTLRVVLRRSYIVDELDYVNGDADDVEIVRLLSLKLAALLGFTIGDPRPGRDYYAFSHTIVNDQGYEVASVSGGGKGQRETFLLSLKGAACNFASPGWEHRLYDWLYHLNPKISRIDLAKDYFNGEHTIEEAMQAYADGFFTNRKRRPDCCLIGDHYNQRERTFYVGRRESGKQCRVYEKAHQYRMWDVQWLRCEVELLGKQRIIPLDALISPAKYFAGAYEYTSRLANETQPEQIPTDKAVAIGSVASVVRWMENTVAPTIVHLSLSCGFDWLIDIAEKHANRPVPKKLKGLSKTALCDGVQRVIQQFKPEFDSSQLLIPQKVCPPLSFVPV